MGGGRSTGQYSFGHNSFGFYQGGWGGWSTSTGWHGHGPAHTFGTWNGFTMTVPGTLIPPVGWKAMRATAIAQGVLNFVCVNGAFVQTSPAQRLSNLVGQATGIHFAATPVAMAAAANPMAANTVAAAAAAAAAAANPAAAAAAAANAA
ncbi:MAG TPA: hypothetical protein VI248_03935, partial [Kineosporiaceae bacterium]